MADIDHGIAASVGATVAGALMAIRDRFRGKPPCDGPTIEQFAALLARVTDLETEVKAMRDIADKIDRINEAVSRLTKSDDENRDAIGDLRVTQARLETLAVSIHEQVGRLHDDVRRRVT